MYFFLHSFSSFILQDLLVGEPLLADRSGSSAYSTSDDDQLD